MQYRVRSHGHEPRVWRADAECHVVPVQRSVCWGATSGDEYALNGKSPSSAQLFVIVHSNTALQASGFQLRLKQA